MTVRKPDPELCLVIPCFNEAEVLPDLLASIRALDLGLRLRVLFVDDGSHDQTFALLAKACAKDKRLACLSFSRNFGHQVAVSAGLQYAYGDLVAVLDADLQDPPELLPDFIAKWHDGFDVVYGIRTNRKESWFLRIAYKIFYQLLNRITHIDIPRDSGDFALMDRRVVSVINQMPEHNRFVRGLRGWAGFRQVGIKYARPARQAGKTSYNMRRLTRLALDGLLSFSSIPLRFSGWIGAAAALLGFCYLAYALIINLSGQSLPEGWTSTVVLVLFLGGVQLMVLGVIGEYISRIFDEVKGRPHYVVREGTGWLKDVETTTPSP